MQSGNLRRMSPHSSGDKHADRAWRRQCAVFLRRPLQCEPELWTGKSAAASTASCCLRILVRKIGQIYKRQSHHPGLALGSSPRRLARLGHAGRCPGPVTMRKVRLLSISRQQTSAWSFYSKAWLATRSVSLIVAWLTFRRSCSVAETWLLLLAGETVSSTMPKACEVARSTTKVNKNKSKQNTMRCAYIHTCAYVYIHTYVSTHIYMYTFI